MRHQATNPDDFGRNGPCGSSTATTRGQCTSGPGRRGDVPAHEARAQGRASQGMRIMNERPGDEVAAVARIA